MLKSFHILLTAWKKITLRTDETQKVPPQKEYFWRSYKQMESFFSLSFSFPNASAFCIFMTSQKTTALRLLTHKPALKAVV